MYIIANDTGRLCIFLWWFCRGCSPLPIPNREVKPLMADGTAPQCGRGGSCHLYSSPVIINDGPFFCLYISTSPPGYLSYHLLRAELTPATYLYLFPSRHANPFL